METLRHQWTADYRSGIISIEGFGAISADGRVFSFRRELDLDETYRSEAIVALAADTGELQWVSDLDFDGADRVPVAPNAGTVVDDTLYVCAITRDDGPDAVLALAVDTGEVRWTTKIDGGVWGSPAVANGLLYASGDGTVYALDVETGEGFWEADLGDFSRSVATDGELVVAVPGNRIVGVDGMTGELRWETELPRVHGNRNSPVLVDDLVVYVHAHTGFVVDATTGDVVWQTDEEAVEGPKPAVTDELVIFVDNDRKSTVGETDTALVRAFSLKDGEIAWETSLETSVSAPPVVVDEQVCVLGMDKTFYVFDTADGARLADTWIRGETSAEPAVTSSGVFIGHDRGITALSAGELAELADVGRWPMRGYDNRNSRRSPDGSSPRTDLERTWSVSANDPAPPLVADGVVIVAERGGLLGINATTGEMRWRKSVGPDQSFTSTATVVGETVIVGTPEGAVLGIRVNDGRFLWEVDTDAEFVPPITAVDGVVYGVDRGGDVYKIDPETGDYSVIGSVNGRVSTMPAVSNGTVVVAHGGLSAISAEGRQLWTKNPARFPVLSPSIFDDLVVAAVNDGTVRAYNINTGTPEWTARLYDTTAGIAMLETAVGSEAVFTIAAEGQETKPAVFGIDSASGEILWRTELSNSPRTKPVLADGLLWVVTDGGGLLGLDTDTGETSVSVDVPGDELPVSELIVTEGRLFGSGRDTIHAFE
jgi:outer membrane protein assembly factor BamB